MLPAATRERPGLHSFTAHQVRTDNAMPVRRARETFAQLKYPGGRVGLVTGADVLAAEGLAFTFVAKGGVVLSAMSGHGFVIRKARGGGLSEPLPE